MDVVRRIPQGDGCTFEVGGMSAWAEPTEDGRWKLSLHIGHGELTAELPSPLPDLDECEQVLMQFVLNTEAGHDPAP